MTDVSMLDLSMTDLSMTDMSTMDLSIARLPTTDLSMPGLDPCLHPLSGFVNTLPAEPDRWDYTYMGQCPRTGKSHHLPRTVLSEAVAGGLMAQLAQEPICEGKMYGVLLVQTPAGLGVLKAFSGLMQGQATRPGWVPPIPGRDRIALQEATTLDQLNAIKNRLLALQHLPERETYAHLAADFAQRRAVLNDLHRQRRQQRATQRQALNDTLHGEELATALAALDQASRGDKAEVRSLKQAQTEALAPLTAQIAAADAEMQRLKRDRKALSQQLQAAMHAVYTLTNFAGESLALQDLRAAGGLPTGTGDCCAPKLLHYAAQHRWQPVALAEFWWGPAQGDKQPGKFYGACEERCQPILGFLLAGLSAPVPVLSPEIPILYIDEALIAVDKPAGLLSVPGRYGNSQESVLSRLRATFPDGEELRPVHRLDQDTSGLLMLARTAASHQALSRQFEQRQVQKGYEAIVEGTIAADSGLIDLPLWGDPRQRPRQVVDWQQGKPSQTRYEVLSRQAGCTRLKFIPITGRTHQLRVHAAHPQGLNAPMRGDRLYGNAQPAEQLHLHAKTLSLIHPVTQQPLTLEATVPF